MNMKANILSRKDQMDTKDNNKNVQILKEKLWSKWNERIRSHQEIGKERQLSLER